MKPTSLQMHRWIAGLFLVAGSLPATLRAAQELELKDETGKTIVKYVIEVPPGIAPGGVTDPTKQVGLALGEVQLPGGAPRPRGCAATMGKAWLP